MTPSDPKELLKRYEPKPVKVITPDRPLCTARFSPSGTLLAAGGTDATIRRWDFSDDTTPELPPLAGHHGWVQTLAFHPDGGRLFSGDSWGQVRCWPVPLADAEEHARPSWSVETAHDGWIRRLVVSPDGTLVATCGRDGNVVVWSADDGSKRHEFPSPGEDIMALAFHPDGKSLVSGTFKGVVTHRDLATGKVERELDARVFFLLDRLQDVGGVRCLTFDATGKRLACAGTWPKNGANVQGIPGILVFDWETGKLEHSLKVGTVGDGYVYDVLWHTDGFLMAVTSGNPGNGRLFFIRPGDKEPFFVHTKMANCQALDAHPDGRRLIVSATNANSNGNGRKLGKNADYPGNFSPLHVWEIPRAPLGES